MAADMLKVCIVLGESGDDPAGERGSRGVRRVNRDSFLKERGHVACILLHRIVTA
jgi:hypothetical protein